MLQATRVYMRNWCYDLYTCVRFSEIWHVCMYGEAVPSGADDGGGSKAVRDEEGSTTEDLAADSVWSIDGLLVWTH